MRARHIARPPAALPALSYVRHNWRRWRRSRPFWGGLLLVLGGIELLALPLTGILSKGQIKLTVYIGIGGIFGVLIGILLITAGIAIWVSPAHRVFYGIAGVVLGIASFPASNLGGFFLCMLLSIIGGSIAFAWTPDGSAAPVPVAPSGPPAPAGPPEPAAGEFIPGLWGDGPALPDSAGPDSARPDPAAGGSEDRATGPRPEGARRMLALAALPVLMSAGVVGAHAALFSNGAAAAAPAAPSQTCILGIICLGGGSSSTASPSPTYSLPTCLPTALPSPLPTPLPSALASLPAYILKELEALPQCVAAALPTSLPTSLPTVPGLPTSLPTVPGLPGAKPTKPADPKAKSARAGGVVAPAAISVITASSAAMDHLTYVGNAKVPLAAGGTVTMMKFTASSLTLSGAAEAITEAGHTVTVSSPVMAFDGNVVLYATKLVGTLKVPIAGLPVGPLTFTPSNAGLLYIANAVTSNTTVTFTSVTTDQALGIADSLTYGPGGRGFSLTLH